METVRVGFIGCGSFANTMHYPNLAEMPGVELVAVCDLDEERLRKTADKYQVPHRYIRYQKMLEKEEIDAVYVVMPPMGLFPIVMDVLESGRPVFMEKPPGMTTEETQAMAEKARQKGVFGMVGFNRRYAEVFIQAKAKVLEAGPPNLAVAEFHKNMLRTGPYYGMSVLRTDIIHVVDALRDLLGDPVEIFAYADRCYANWVNNYNALIRFKSGAVGYLTGNRSAGSRYERFEFHSPGVSAYIRAPEIAEIYYDGRGEPKILRPQNPDPRKSYGYWTEDLHFIDCVRRKQPPITNLEDAVLTMALVDAIEGGKHAEIPL